MATFVKLTRAVGGARGQFKWVNMDWVTDFSRQHDRDATAVFFRPTPDIDAADDKPWALLVRETPDEIMEALAKHG